MNFYKAQDQARKQSRRLVALFCIAVVLIVALTNVLLVVIAWLSDFGNLASTHRAETTGLPWYESLWLILNRFGWDKIAVVSASICGVIAIATWSKWSELSKGGHVVAEVLGGTLIDPDSKEPRQRRLLNVVEEMALASQMPVPPVYVLQGEAGINAFAAGASTDDAVIAMSRGAMEQLNREQLQGVVAHEFSHILNGDMRLNIRIVATLHGLLMINEAGRLLMHAGSFGRRRSYRYSGSGNRDNGARAVVFVAGLAIWLLGTIGQFFGSVIKAALSRQREYLADASAVQFTRNPNGIAGALRIIGGYGSSSRVENPHAYELGHIFFSNAFQSRVFSTHPPLDDRISRLMPSWAGDYLESTADLELRNEGAMGFAGGASHETDTRSEPIRFDRTASADTARSALEDAGIIPAAVASSSLGEKKEEQNIAPLLERVHSAAEAKAAFYGFIGHQAIGVGDWQETLQKLSLSQQLDIMRAALPGLKSMSRDEYEVFRGAFIAAIARDKKRSVREWLAYELFRNPCDIHFGLASTPILKYRNLQSIAGFYQIVLCKFIQMGTEPEIQKQALEASRSASGIDVPESALQRPILSKEFTNACYELKKAFPLLKPRIIKGLLAAANADQQFCETEQQLISVLAAIWDLPLPALEASEQSA